MCETAPIGYDPHAMSASPKITSEQVTPPAQIAPTIRCDKCGVQSPLKELFTRSRKSFSTRTQTLCPVCARKVEDRIHLVMFLMAIGILALYLLPPTAKAPPRDHAAPWSSLGLPLFLIVQYVSVIPHELSHALAGKLMGIELFRISFGRGRLLVSRAFRGVLIEIRAIPGSGGVNGGTLRMAGWRWRMFVYVAAGPLIHVLICGASVRAAGGWPHIFDTSRWSGLAPFWLSLAAANAAILVASLIPHTVKTQEGLQPTDGRLLLNLLFKPIDSVIVRRMRYFLSRGAFLCIARDGHAAKEMLRQALDEFPGNLTLRLLLIIAHLEAGEYATGRELTLRLLEERPAADAVRASLLNALAWADLMIATPERMEEADRASAESYALTPWDFAVQSTRGLAMVELGDLAGGEELLRQSFRGAERRESRAAVACSLAIAESRMGRGIIARRMLRKARRLDRKCELLPRVEREVLAVGAPA